MQLFSEDATEFKKKNFKNAHENIKKVPSKVAYFTAQSKNFSTANWPKTSHHFILCSIKMAHRGTFIYNDFTSNMTVY